MNEREFERLLASVVDEGPLAIDDRVIDLALAEIPTTPQRGMRAALLERLVMQFRLVPILGGAAALALLIGSLAILGLPGGPGTPSPSADSRSEVYAPSQFRLPVELTLPLTFFEAPVDPGVVPGGIVPWTKHDRPSMLSIVAPGPYNDRLTIIPVSNARIVGDAGEEPWPTDLAAWLAEQPGISDSDRTAPPVTIAGASRVNRWLDLDPGARTGGNVLIRTDDGEAVMLPSAPSSLFVIDVPDGLAEPVVVIVSSGPDAPDANANWLENLVRIAESIKPA